MIVTVPSQKLNILIFSRLVLVYMIQLVLLFFPQLVSRDRKRKIDRDKEIILIPVNGGEKNGYLTGVTCRGYHSLWYGESVRRDEHDIAKMKTRLLWVSSLWVLVSRHQEEATKSRRSNEWEKRGAIARKKFTFFFNDLTWYGPNQCGSNELELDFIWTATYTGSHGHWSMYGLVHHECPSTIDKYM